MNLDKYEFTKFSHKIIDRIKNYIKLDNVNTMMFSHENRIYTIYVSVYHDFLTIDVYHNKSGKIETYYVDQEEKEIPEYLIQVLNKCKLETQNSGI